MAAEEYSPDPFDESPPKEMKYLKNPKKMTISQFEKIPKKLIVDKKLEEGKIYYIEGITRRKKDYREVYQGMYFPDPYSKDDDTLTFKYVSIIVAPFGDGGMPMGFLKKNHKFYEATTIPNRIDQSRFKDNIGELDNFIATQKAAPVEKDESNISFIGKDYRKSKQRFNTLKKASGNRKRKSKRKPTQKSRRKPNKISRKKQSRKLTRRRKQKKMKRTGKAGFVVRLPGLNDMPSPQPPVDYSSMSDQELIDIIENPSTTIEALIDIINEKNVIENNSLQTTSRVGYIALRKYNQRANEFEIDDNYVDYLNQATTIIDEEKENPTYPVEGVQYNDENGDELSISAYQEQFRIRPLTST